MRHMFGKGIMKVKIGIMESFWLVLTSYKLLWHLIHISSLIVHVVKWMIFLKKSHLQIIWWVLLWRILLPYTNRHFLYKRKTFIKATKSCHLALGWKPPVIKSKGTKWSRNVENYWCLFDGLLWLLLIHLQHISFISMFFPSYHQTISLTTLFPLLMAPSVLTKPLPSLIKPNVLVS